MQVKAKSDRLLRLILALVRQALLIVLSGLFTAVNSWENLVERQEHLLRAQELEPKQVTVF